jgi:hypothetical protein
MAPIALILMVSLACGGTANTGTKVGEVGATQTSPSINPTKPIVQNTPTPTSKPQNAVYKVGDVIDLGDHMIAMYGAEYRGDMLDAKFIVGNTGDKEINLSSLLSFSAKNPDSTKLDIDIFDCGSSLDGSMPPGDILRGEICWTGAQPGVKVYYEASLFGTGAVVWEVPETVADLDIQFPGLTDLEIKQTMYKVGELIDADGHYIALTGAEYQNDLLVASFILGNNSDSDVSISSMVSFSAKNPSGEKLEQEIFDCSPGLDGTMVPGDRLQGKICWKGAEPGTKIYYDASLFEAGMIVWEITESVPPTQMEFPQISNLSIKQQTFKVGDIVDVRNHKITLNSLTLDGMVLKVNFTIENNGTDDVNVSSLVSFAARNPDGTVLSQSLLDCGTSLDGTIIPGDKLKGDICWDGATSGARVYYDASIFSSGMVIWDLQ